VSRTPKSEFRILLYGEDYHPIFQETLLEDVCLTTRLFLIGKSFDAGTGLEHNS